MKCRTYYLICALIAQSTMLMGMDTPKSSPKISRNSNSPSVESLIFSDKFCQEENINKEKMLVYLANKKANTSSSSLTTSSTSLNGSSAISDSSASLDTEKKE